ncbi:MAG TPA: hypothetical protein VGI61_07220 [Parafilimonas sp.]
MEVHHHPKVEKKNFKGYFLEFLMIFLAVTLGFFAEGIRENISDNAKEKEYIYSMIEDAATDTANIRQAIELNKNRIMHLDSLTLLCANYDASKKMDAEMYRHYKPGLVHPAFISPTERTIQQLKNAGGMRLIRKKAAVDSIILYDDVAKKLADQQAYYELYQNKSMDLGVQIFNYLRFGFGAAGANLKNFTDKDSTVKLLTTDKVKLMQFANEISVYEGVVHFYNVRLQEMNAHAVNLINTLKKEYRLNE